MEIQSVSTHSPRRDNKHAKENHKNTSKSLRKIRIKIPLVKKKKNKINPWMRNFQKFTGNTHYKNYACTTKQLCNKINLSFNSITPEHLGFF